LEKLGEEIERVPLAMVEAMKARYHRLAVGVGVGWAVSVVVLGVLAWLIFLT
jgi:hypothetical protein